MSVAYPVVFAATCSRCTLQTFGIGDITCLLGPVDQASLRRTVRGLRLLNKRIGRRGRPSLSTVVHDLGGRRGCGARFLIPIGKSGLLPISMRTVRCFCVSGKLIGTMSDRKGRFIFSRSLSRLTRRLGPRSFFQTGHRFVISQGTMSSVDL